jgi:putative oxidoreductase
VKTIRALLLHRTVLRLIAIAIGVTLIWASIDKLHYPDRFADVVHDYDMLPLSLVNAFALAMPAVEVVTGLALIVGLWRRPAGLLAVGLFAAFMIAIAQAQLRGLQIECGCFSVSDMSASQATWGLFARDVVYLAGSMLVWRRG